MSLEISARSVSTTALCAHHCWYTPTPTRRGCIRPLVSCGSFRFERSYDSHAIKITRLAVSSRLFPPLGILPSSIRCLTSPKTLTAGNRGVSTLRPSTSVSCGVFRLCTAASRSRLGLEAQSLGRSLRSSSTPAPSSNMAAANWHIRAVSVPGIDTDLTLQVSFDNARFMFGCGEGTQRAYVQKKVSMRGLQGIFLPSTKSVTRSGLPGTSLLRRLSSFGARCLMRRRADALVSGVIMTAADSSGSKISVIGPPDTAHYISTFRSSVQR